MNIFEMRDGWKPESREPDEKAAVLTDQDLLSIESNNPELSHRTVKERDAMEAAIKEYRSALAG